VSLPRIPLVLSPSVRMEQERWAADLAVGAVSEIRRGGSVLGSLAWSPAAGWEVVGFSRGFEEKAEAVRFLVGEVGGSLAGLSSRDLSPVEVSAFLAEQAEIV
jgi:hypothetical protein